MRTVHSPGVLATFVNKALDTSSDFMISNDKFDSGVEYLSSLAVDSYLEISDLDQRNDLMFSSG